jgi:hypothetical protein
MADGSAPSYEQAPDDPLAVERPGDPNRLLGRAGTCGFWWWDASTPGTTRLGGATGTRTISLSTSPPDPGSQIVAAHP